MTGTEPTPERLAKLPAWARNHITKLESRNDRLRSQLEAATTIFDPDTLPAGTIYTNTDHIARECNALTDNRVHVAAGEPRSYIEISATASGSIAVRGSAGITVEPISSNWINVRLGP